MHKKAIQHYEWSFLLLYKNTHFRSKRGYLPYGKYPLNVQKLAIFPKNDF